MSKGFGGFVQVAPLAMQQDKSLVPGMQLPVLFSASSLLFAASSDATRAADAAVFGSVSSSFAFLLSPKGFGKLSPQL